MTASGNGVVKGMAALLFKLSDSDWHSNAEIGAPWPLVVSLERRGYLRTRIRPFYTPVDRLLQLTEKGMELLDRAVSRLLVEVKPKPAITYTSKHPGRDANGNEVPGKKPRRGLGSLLPPPQVALLPQKHGERARSRRGRAGFSEKRTAICTRT